MNKWLLFSRPRVIECDGISVMVMYGVRSDGRMYQVWIPADPRVPAAIYERELRGKLDEFLNLPPEHGPVESIEALRSSAAWVEAA